MGTVRAVCISERKGEQKTPVGSIELVVGSGIAGDAHAGDWHRQVSLLAWESIEKLRVKGLNVDEGHLAENITTHGIELPVLPVGTRLAIADAILEITQIGKECHAPCAIYYQAGECVMPKEGVFAIVVKGGIVQAGDAVEILTSRQPD
jgi:MOSC domain-containing protein YiiM